MGFSFFGGTFADYDRGRAMARLVSPSQELWIVLGGVLRDSIRLLRNMRVYRGRSKGSRLASTKRPGERGRRLRVLNGY